MTVYGRSLRAWKSTFTDYCAPCNYGFGFYCFGAVGLQEKRENLPARSHATPRLFLIVRHQSVQFTYGGAWVLELYLNLPQQILVEAYKKVGSGSLK